MKLQAGNLFNVSAPGDDCKKDQEQIEGLASGDCRIERIVSAGQASPPGYWYDQEQDEWVALLQGKARLQWENAPATMLGAGDWLLIPAHCKHRVAWTSVKPPCIWLAVHGSLKSHSR